MVLSILYGIIIIISVEFWLSYLDKKVKCLDIIPQYSE